MLTFHAETDVGRRREHNEDAVYAGDGLLVVCDGMGGHQAGEVASQMTVEVIADFIARSRNDPELTWPFGFDTQLSDAANRLATAIRLANQAVFQKSIASEECRGMGTTVVAALVPRNRPEVVYAHVGDSRLYLLRDGALTQLTRDDSVAALISGGDAGESSGSGGEPVLMRNVLTKALGVRDEVEPTVATGELRPGDLLLLCSDGLTTMLPDGAILEVLRAHGHDLEEACHRLVAAANQQGGRDNVTVLLARWEG
jgi:protein phosphatase